MLVKNRKRPPSPRPSPPRRGRACSPFWQLRSSRLQSPFCLCSQARHQPGIALLPPCSGRWFPLSPRERVGVRGNATPDINSAITNWKCFQCRFPSQSFFGSLFSPLPICVHPRPSAVKKSPPVSNIAKPNFCAIVSAHEISKIWADRTFHARHLLRRHALSIQMAGR